MVGVLVLVAIVFVWWQYENFKKNGMRPRTVTTALSPQEVRDVFRAKVATLGWQIVDEGNPMIAQSSLLNGIRQQMACEVSRDDEGRTVAQIAVLRYSKKVLGGTTKAHTLRLRINAFCSELARRDPQALVVG